MVAPHSLRIDNNRQMALNEIRLTLSWWSATAHYRAAYPQCTVVNV